MAQSGMLDPDVRSDWWWWLVGTIIAAFLRIGVVIALAMSRGR